jgi:hypothetical protein
MTGFFKRGDKLEGELRATRPRPSDELVSRLEGRVRSELPARVRRSSFRVAVPVALTAVMVGALAAVGGVSYAATSVENAVKAVSHVFSPAKAHGTLTIAGATAGGDQYQPGFGFGDQNHNHSGPPGLNQGNGNNGNGNNGNGNNGNGNGSFTPPLTPKVVGNTATIATSFTIDEQAHLFISIVDKSTGAKLLITQTKSKIGTTLKGQQAKNVNYLVLVPRTIPLKLALPAKLLLAGHSYAIQVIARDPQGNETKLLIPFKG